MTPADILAEGLHLSLPTEQPEDVAPGTICSITGQPITTGYRVADMVTGATAEFLDCFRGGVHGWVSESAARCFRSANPRAGNPCARSQVAFIEPDSTVTLWQPLIARESAQAQGRKCWRDLAREIWPARRGQQCLFILTTDTKKRLWPRARVGSLGSRTPMFYYDGGTCGNEVLFLDWPKLLACLDLVEAVYQAGFPKEPIRQSLYLAGKVAQTVGLRETTQMERALVGWRGTAEMLVATLIAQKEETPDGSRPVQSPNNIRAHQRDTQLALL